MRDGIAVQDRVIATMSEAPEANPEADPGGAHADAADRAGADARTTADESAAARGAGRPDGGETETR